MSAIGELLDKLETEAGTKGTTVPPTTAAAGEVAKEVPVGDASKDQPPVDLPKKKLAEGEPEETKKKPFKKDRGGDDESVISNEAENFPTLYQHLPRFWTIGVENGNRATLEPTSVNLYKSTYAEQWVLLISFPGVKAPFGSWSVRKILTRAHRFVERNCHVFLLSTDPWTKVREYRTLMENKVVRPTGTSAGTKLYDVDGVTFIVDPHCRVSKKLGMLCEGRNDRKVCYPGYLLLTPDNELVQYCIIKDKAKMYERDEKTFFAYPITEEALDNLADCLDTLVPIYNMVSRLRSTYPRASFGTFVENMILLVQSDSKKDEGQKESIFKWRGWAERFGGVLGGNLP